MRYGPILLLSMSPLLGLTVWGFVRLAMDDPTQLPPELAPAERQEAAIQPTEALEKAAAAKKRTNSAQGIVEQLASCGLCGLHSEAFADALAKLGKISPSDPLSQEWRSVSDTWTGSIKARQALDQFQPVAEAISKLPTAPSSRQDKAGMEKYRVKVEELKGTVQRCANDWNARYASVLGSQVIHDRLQPWKTNWEGGRMMSVR